MIYNITVLYNWSLLYNIIVLSWLPNSTLIFSRAVLSSKMMLFSSTVIHSITLLAMSNELEAFYVFIVCISVTMWIGTAAHMGFYSFQLTSLISYFCFRFSIIRLAIQTGSLNVIIIQNVNIFRNARNLLFSVLSTPKDDFDHIHLYRMSHM